MSAKKIDRKHVRRFAQEMHAAAEEMAPGGRGLPGACRTADELHGWADLLAELVTPRAKTAASCCITRRAVE